MRLVPFVTTWLLTLVPASRTFAQSRPSARAVETQSAGGSTGTTRQASAARQAIARGQTAHAAGRYEEALAAFREAAAQSTDRGEALLGVAAALERRNDHDGAVAALRESLQASTAAGDVFGRLRALQGLGIAYEAAGQWDDALRTWRDFVALAEANPSLASAVHGRARVHAIEQRASAQRQYAPVRERIAARQRSAPSTNR